MKKRVAIRLDVGPAIGSGHLMRCLALAQAMRKYTELDVLFICRIPLQVKINFPVVYLSKEYCTEKHDYNFPSISDEISEIIQVMQLRKVDCLIVDHYGAKNSYFELLKSKINIPILCIDDNLEREIYVDGVINGNIFANNSFYPGVNFLLLGGNYTLLREEFWKTKEKHINTQLADIYVTSGGADPLGFCHEMISVLLEWNSAVRYHVIVGADFQKEYIKRLSQYNVELIENANMKKCMEVADLFVTSAGSTLYELAAVGTPSISFILSDDQINVGETFWRLGGSISGGYFKRYDKEKFRQQLVICCSNTVRKKYSDTSKKIVSLHGAINTAVEIEKYLLD